MKQINTKERSEEIYGLFNKLLKEFICVGERNWGNPAGSFGNDTYAVSNSKTPYGVPILNGVIQEHIKQTESE